MAEQKTKGWLTMRLNNMHDYLTRVESIQSELNQTNFRVGTAEHEDVKPKIDEINQKIQAVKQMGFVKVKGDE